LATGHRGQIIFLIISQTLLKVNFSTLNDKVLTPVFHEIMRFLKLFC